MKETITDDNACLQVSAIDVRAYFFYRWHCNTHARARARVCVCVC